MITNRYKSWWPKVKNGGILSGHDYHYEDWPGVALAVNEFVSKNKLELNLTGTDSPRDNLEYDGGKPSWWVIKTENQC